MSLQSVVMFDGTINYDTYSSADPVSFTHDIGFVTTWYVLSEGVTILTADVPGNPSFLANSVAGLSTVSKLSPTDGFSFAEANNEPQQEEAAGPNVLKAFGAPARVITVSFGPNQADFSGLQHIKITLFYFKDTGLLATN